MSLQMQDGDSGDVQLQAEMHMQMQDADSHGETSGEYAARNRDSLSEGSDFEVRRRLSETEEISHLRGALLARSHNRRTNTNTNIN